MHQRLNQGEVTGQWRSSSVAWYSDARIRANASWSLTASFFLLADDFRYPDYSTRLIVVTNQGWGIFR